MHIRGIGGELKFTLLPRTPSQSRAEPDLHIECSATTQQFVVAASRAWLEWRDVQAFVAELEALNQSLVGKAALFAMSPSDFTLTLVNLDSRGHIGVSFTIGSRNYTENGRFESSVSGGFEVLPGEVEAMLNWFKAIIASEPTA